MDLLNHVTSLCTVFTLYTVTDYKGVSNKRKEEVSGQFSINGGHGSVARRCSSTNIYEGH